MPSVIHSLEETLHAAITTALAGATVLLDRPADISHEIENALNQIDGPHAVLAVERDYKKSTDDRNPGPAVDLNFYLVIIHRALDRGRSGQDDAALILAETAIGHLHGLKIPGVHLNQRGVRLLFQSSKRFVDTDAGHHLHELTFLATDLILTHTIRP